MKDFFMGSVVEIEEFALGEAPPEVTPPHGVILTQRENDGWTRRYLYRRYSDLSGKHVESKVLYSEKRPDASELVRGVTQVAIPFQPVAPAAAPAMDGRLRFPMNTQVKLMGQAAPAPAAPAAAASADQPVPLSQAPAAAPAAPPAPALPAVCDRAMQLPDGTILNPDDAITFKDFCALLPYIMEQKKSQTQAQGPARPGGPIPLSNPFGATPSFGPAGGPFAQGGGGGGGGGTPGPGPIGVINSPVIQGAGQPGTQGPPGAPGPAGPAGPGSALDGAKIVVPFTNGGVMAVVPGSTFQIVVAGDGKCEFNFSAILTRIAPRASIWDVMMGIQIGATQYLLWEDNMEIGAGSDQGYAMTAAATLFETLAPGTYQVSLLYGYNPGLNGWMLDATAVHPASISCKHS